MEDYKSENQTRFGIKKSLHDIKKLTILRFTQLNNFISYKDRIRKRCDRIQRK